MNFHMVWGIGLITASSLLMNDATHSEASESLAGSSHYREERHHCRKDDLRQSNRHSRLKQLSLKAHFHYQVQVSLSLMLIDAVWKRQRRETFWHPIHSLSFSFFFFFFLSFSVIILKCRVSRWAESHTFCQGSLCIVLPGTSFLTTSKGSKIEFRFKKYMKQIYSQRSYCVLVGFGTFLFVFILFCNFLYSFFLVFVHYRLLCS